MAKHTMDLTTGPVTKKLLLFMLPILASNLLQQFYTAADTAVVGKFASETALAAVGSTSHLTSLLLSLFVGLATGTNVVCAKYRGAQNEDKLRSCMHTSLLLGLACGLFLGSVGFALTRPILELMGSPDTVIDQSTLYVRIFFLGVPASLLYNFASAILRAHGDTKRPMIILGISGLMNVLLNLLFVIVLHMDVAGVALATIISQYFSMAAALYMLFTPNGEFKMNVKELKFDSADVGEIVGIGLPTGINSSLYGIANVILQSTVNSFGDVVMAASAASTNVTAFMHIIMGAFSTACVSFTGQCAGAKKFDRIEKMLVSCIVGSTIGILLYDVVVTIFHREFLGCFTNNPEVVNIAREKLLLNSWGYLVCCISDPLVGVMRGSGRSTMPTVLNISGICIPRLLWIFFIFPLNPTFLMLNISYPVSWGISTVVQVCYYLNIRKKIKAELAI